MQDVNSPYKHESFKGAPYPQFYTHYTQLISNRKAQELQTPSKQMISQIITYQEKIKENYINKNSKWNRENKRI